MGTGIRSRCILLSGLHLVPYHHTPQGIWPCLYRVHDLLAPYIDTYLLFAVVLGTDLSLSGFVGNNLNQRK